MEPWNLEPRFIVCERQETSKMAGVAPDVLTGAAHYHWGRTLAPVIWSSGLALHLQTHIGNAFPSFLGSPRIHILHIPPISDRGTGIYILGNIVIDTYWDIRMATHEDTHEDTHDDAGLLKLPGEVRNEIYGHLVSCGDLSLMRTNRQIYTEMMGLVLSSTPYRLYVNYPLEARYPRRLPDGKIGEGIQNVEIHWRFQRYRRFLKCGGSVWVLQLDPLVSRKRCVVYFERTIYMASWIKARDLTALGELAVFSEVIFRVTWKEGVEIKSTAEVEDRYGIWVLRNLGKGMELVLGVGLEGKDEEGRFLRFGPSGKERSDGSGVEQRKRLRNWSHRRLDLEDWEEDVDVEWSDVYEEEEDDEEPLEALMEANYYMGDVRSWN